MTDSRLQIRRVQAQYLVPSDHPAPFSLKDRLDLEIRHSLTQALRASLASWFSKTDTSIWFVRQLELDFAVNAAGSGEDVSRTFTRQFGRALNDTIRDSAESNNVVRFASPADYLARFLSDLAAGVAWGRWYYESFFGLRLLPTSAAIRTAVCDTPDLGKAALLQLRTGELSDVLRALNAQDARLVLDTLTKGLTAGDQFDAHQVGWSLLRLRDIDWFDGMNEWCRALGLYLHVVREHAETVLNFPELVDLLSCSPDQLRQVSTELDAIRAKTRIATSDNEQRNTPCGGIFLLLPLLDELPLEECSCDWPHADDAAAISLIRFLISVKSLGPANGQRTFADPLLRDLLLIPPTLSVDALKEWQSSITSSHLDTFLKTLIDWQRSQGRVTDQRQLENDLAYLSPPDSLRFTLKLDHALNIAAQHILRSFARRLPGFAGSTLPYLWSNFLDFPASVEEESTRRVVRVCGPPLRLVLGLTGMTRQTYRLSWLDRPVSLFEES